MIRIAEIGVVREIFKKKFTNLQEHIRFTEWSGPLGHKKESEKKWR